MSLPTSGAISVAQISAEIGRAATATTSLGETEVRNLAGIASGAISLSQFYGLATLINPPTFGNFQKIAISPASSTAAFYIRANGTWDNSAGNSGSWRGASSQSFEVWFEVLSGSLGGGSNGASAWKSTATDHAITVYKSGTTGSLSAVVRVHLRVAGNPATEITKDITITATVEA